MPIFKMCTKKYYCDNKTLINDNHWIVGNVGIYLYNIFRRMRGHNVHMDVWVSVYVCFEFLTFCEGKLFVQP